MTRTPKQQFDNYAEHMARMLGASAPPPRNRPRRPGIWASGGMADAPVVEVAPEPTVDLAAENEALRRRIAELETIPEPTPDPEPETHFADLMLADETLDDARVRLSQRLRELRHYLMAPEIRVNEDGSLGLTGEEQSELQDLERRQTLGRWLEA
jgi:hypothetical protein